MHKADRPSLTSNRLAEQVSNSQSLEANLEGAILEYAINTFPFADSFDYFPGLENADSVSYTHLTLPTTLQV